MQKSSMFLAAVAAAFGAVAVGCYEISADTPDKVLGAAVNVDAGTPSVADVGTTSTAECRVHSDCPAGKACVYGTCATVVVGATDAGTPHPYGCDAIGNETCNGRDDDCDAATDEGCPQATACVHSTTQPCGPSLPGECRRGTQTCTNGAWSACAGGVSAVAESCNGRDDDCDGFTDEDPNLACGSPFVEVCNGVDDDRDGQTDEGCPIACVSGETRSCGSVANPVGACRRGTQACTNGAWSACTGAVDPLPETCNATDDDCNGQTDEGAVICANGQRCVSGQCRVPPVETCNGADDDGDGLIDEQGACEGSQVCERPNNGLGSLGCYEDRDRDTIVDASDNCPDVANVSQVDTDHDGRGDVCDTEVETCNGADDDRDGQVDEGSCASSQYCLALPVTCAYGGNCVTPYACQADTDRDGIGDGRDNCPNVANADQADANGNGVGNACEGTPQPPPPPAGSVTLEVRCPTNDAACALHAWWGAGQSLTRQPGRLTVALDAQRCSWGVALNAQQGGVNGSWYTDLNRLGDLNPVYVNGAQVTGHPALDPGGHYNLMLAPAQLGCAQ